MNSLLQLKWSWVEGSIDLRDQILNTLTDADLAFTPGGQAMTLGALLRELGEVQHSYGQSFKTLTHDFGYRNTEPGLDQNLARLKAWYTALDADMKATLAAFSDADMKKKVARGGGFDTPIEMQLDIYLQALLIFLGKATVYLRAMSKPLPQQVQEWIG
jgi:hypothetical protein